jgi:hypothetical protein
MLTYADAIPADALRVSVREASPRRGGAVEGEGEGEGEKMRRMVALAARQQLGKRTKASIQAMAREAGVFVSPQKTAKADASLCGALTLLALLVQKYKY